MRVLLISDVHANWEALLSLQRAEQRPDAVLFAGDAVGYGPDPSNCARWLLANATLAVRGNHDDALAHGAWNGLPPELEDAARETVDYARAFLAPADRDGLGRWPASASITLGAARFYVTHGTPFDPLGGQINPATCPEAILHAMFDDIPADVIVLGHTHMPAIRQFGERVIVNPGSLGQPRYGVPDATYAVWEDGHLRIHHLHYDHDAPANKLRLMHLSPEVADQLANILETGMV
jgi:putative phosphoesterase